MKRILFLQNKFLHYREAFYESLAEHYDVTVLHSGSPRHSAVKEVLVDTKKIGPFVVVPGFRELLEDLKPDCIVSMFDLHWPQFIFLPSEYSGKLIYWGLDNGRTPGADTLKRWVINKMRRPVIFYSVDVLNRWRNLLTAECYVAQNTIPVLSANVSFDHERNKFINVGALVQRKRNDLLFRAFARLPDHVRQSTSIEMVGEGKSMSELQSLASELGIDDFVHFLGHIDDPKSLSQIFNTAIACVSVGQAGLAVSLSVGHGVPFICHKKAITGGEMFAVVEGTTGERIDCDFTDELIVKRLTHVMMRFWRNRASKSVYMAARDWYDENLSNEQMVNSFRVVIADVVK